MGDFVNIKDIMSTGIIVCNGDDSISFVSHLMKENDIGFVPVVSNNKVIGVVTDRDIVVKVISNGDLTSPISSYINNNIISISVLSSVDAAIKALSNNKIKRLLVCDDDKVVGVLSISDLINNISSDLLADTIRKIWSVSSNVHYNDTDVSDFYL